MVASFVTMDFPAFEDLLRDGHGRDSGTQAEHSVFVVVTA